MTIATYNLKSGSQCDSLRRHVSVIKGVIPSDIYHFPLKFNLIAIIPFRINFLSFFLSFIFFLIQEK